MKGCNAAHGGHVPRQDGPPRAQGVRRAPARHGLPLPQVQLHGGHGYRAARGGAEEKIRAADGIGEQD